MEKTYAEIFETLGLEATQQLDLDRTLTGTDWRDTLRDSLPVMPLGSQPDAQFRIERELGRGGMGLVHLAHQPSLGRDVAIKTVHAETVSRDTESALLQEARVMGIVEHPNVVPVHVIGQDEAGRPIIVMKRIQGTTWDAYLTGATEVPQDDVLAFHLTVFISVCNALAFAHSRGVLHRDIKPENVMIGQFGEVYLLDWGLAATIKDIPRLPPVSAATMVVGTPVYMAPEMTTGEGAKQGIHTDIYLLGGLLYTIATGNPPNQGKTLFEVMSFAYTGQARPYPDDAPSELVAICERALAHEPSARFQSADEVRHAIEGFSSHRNSHVLVASALERATEFKSALGTPRIETPFAESRFAFMSALEIWPENAEAKQGLQSLLTAMIRHRVETSDLTAAQALLRELPFPDDELTQLVESQSKVAEKQARRLAKIAYDYDEQVGISSRRWVVGVMAAVFAAAPFGVRWLAAALPAGFMSSFSNDPTVIAANLTFLAFIPILLALFVHTFVKYGNHKTSRIFTLGLAWMYVLAVGARTTTLWSGSSLVQAAAAESAIFSSGLIALALAVDRRLGRAGFVYAVTGLTVILVQDYPIEIYCAGSCLACVVYLAGRDVLMPWWIRDTEP